MRHIVCLLMVLVVLLSTSCKKTQKEAGENTELKVGVMASMDFLPVVVAWNMGLFDKYQVTVDIHKFYSANERDAAFQSGDIDGTVIDYTGAILQRAGGVDLKITSACNATFCLMTGPGTNINQLTDLKGKKVAVSRNTVIDFCVESALGSVGLTGADVEKQEINKIPVRFEMMMSGQTDATALPDPFITIATSKGAKTICSMEDLGYAVTGFMFKTEAIEQKSEQLKAFYLAYNEAVEYIRTHSLNDIRSILTTDIGFPEALVDSVRLPAYTPAMMPRDKDIDATIGWLRKKGLVSADFSTKDLLDSSFVKQQ